ncbi:MAG TPA: hypothetical protein EYG03_12175, partial [Planctomycetes bacterium]|nr:hypothetical protein [Planctomycetota bacterium]
MTPTECKNPFLRWVAGLSFSLSPRLFKRNSKTHKTSVITMLNPKTNIIACRYRQSLCLLTIIAAIASSALIPRTMAKDPLVQLHDLQDQEKQNLAERQRAEENNFRQVLIPALREKMQDVRDQLDDAHQAKDNTLAQSLNQEIEAVNKQVEAVHKELEAVKKVHEAEIVELNTRHQEQRDNIHRSRESVAAGFKVFVIDDNGNETELETGVTFKVDGSGGRGTRVTVEFSDSVKHSMKGKKVRLKRGGVSVAESVITEPVANPQAVAGSMNQSDKQALMAELQSIQQQEWKDLQALHEEEIADFQKVDKGFQDQLAAGNLSQEKINTLLAQQQKNIETLRGAIDRHETDRTRLQEKHDSERDVAIATLFKNGGEDSGLTEQQLSEALIGTTPSGTTPSGTTNDSQIASSISRQARGKFADFNSLPVNPLPAGTPASNVAPINRQQEDARQEIVRTVFIIGHFDHVAEHTDNVFAGAPGGAAQAAGGRQVKFFPAPEETDAQGNAYHPAVADGGTNIRFQKWVRELPRVPVYYPIDISPGLLNTEELRRGYNPARWSAMGVGQTFHGVAPEYWQHASDWEQQPTLFFERLFVGGSPDVMGNGTPTPVWGYGDGGPNYDRQGPGQGKVSVPGPCFIGRFAEPFVVRDTNLLAHGRGSHLHGAHSPNHSDGSPHFFVSPGKARDYYYPNIPPRAHDANLEILAEMAKSGVEYTEAAENLNIPVYVSRPGPAPAGDDPPDGWPVEFDGTPARVNRLLGPLGGVAGSKWEMADMTDTDWYHDHAMDETGPGVYSGVAGYYMTTDPTSE